MNRQHASYVQPQAQWWVRGVFTSIIALPLLALDAIFIDKWGGSYTKQTTGSLIYFIFCIVITLALGAWSFIFNALRVCRQTYRPHEEPMTRSVYYGGFQGFTIVVLVGGIGQSILWAVAAAIYLRDYPDLLGLSIALSVFCLLISIVSILSILLDASERRLGPYTLRNHV